jgi:hypothetical protein
MPCLLALAKTSKKFLLEKTTSVTCELRALTVRKRRKGYGCTERGTDAPEEVRKHRKRYGSTRIRSPCTIILAFIYTAALLAVEQQA